MNNIDFFEHVRVEIKSRGANALYLMSHIREIGLIAEAITKAMQHGNKLMICGNGGSAADAQHLAAELVGQFNVKRRALPALALTTDTSVITSISNDISYNHIFERQVEALGKHGDVLLGISTSGMSENVCKAMLTARGNGIITIGLTGSKNIETNKIQHVADILLSVPALTTPEIQEQHLVVEYILCSIIEAAFVEYKQDELTKGKKTYCFDLDGTLCTWEKNGKYNEARPLRDRIAVVNKLYEAGNTIMVYTARGVSLGIDFTELTTSQLKEWGVKFHELRMQKPHYDIIVDDKALSDNEFFMKMVG